MLKTVAERSDVDHSSGSSRRVKDLGRCVNPTRPSLPTITDDIRIVRDIESGVRERASCARDLREYHPGSTEECLIAWRKEVLEILRAFDVRGPQVAISRFPKSPQGNLGPGGVLEVGDIEEHVRESVGAEPPVPASDMVHYGFATSPRP